MNRCTMLFNQGTADNRSAGWSESWYKDGAVAATLRSLRDLAVVRARMLGGRGKIVGLRVQVIGGGSVTEPGGWPGPERIEVDLPNVALLCKVTDSTLVKKKVFSLRGVPDLDVGEGAFTNQTGLRQQLQAFGRELSSGGWQFRVRDTTVAPVDLVSIDANGAFVLAAALAYNVGDVFTLLRVRDENGNSVVGNFRVGTKTNDTTGAFNNWTGAVVAGSGKVRKFAYAYPAVAAQTLEPIRAMTRKVGRPFGAFSGRRSRRR